MPVPPRPEPVYASPPEKVHESRERRHVVDVLDGVFFIAATVATVLLAWLMAVQGLEGSWAGAGYLVLVWALVAYLLLPRVHLLLTSIYVPDYFIGRSRTADGLLGDPVNLAAMGSEEQVHAAMQAAGWTLADPVNLRSSWGIIVSSLTRRSYPKAPVSPLFVFGNMQDFAYQKEVDGNPAQRHHIRFWRCPDGWLLPGGERVDWVAGGTYDRSVGVSLFTLQVTHKIDADIDIERDYVVATLQHADPGIGVRVLEDFTTGYHHVNGGGDAIRTDGNLPVVDVSGVAVPPEGRLDLPPRDEAADDDIGRRPASIVTGVVLSLVTLCLEVFSAVGATQELLAESGPAEQQVVEVAVAAIAVFVVLLSVVVLLLAVQTFRGSSRARMWLLGLVCLRVFGTLATQVTGGEPVTAVAVGQAAIDILTVCFFSGRSARAWTEPSRARRRARRLARRAR